MKFYKILIYSLLSLLFYSFKSNCDSENQIKNLILTIFNEIELVGYYKSHLNLNQQNLVILKNEILNKEYLINKNEKPVLFLSELEIKNKKIESYFEFDEFKIEGDTANIEVFYKIEGVLLIAKFVKVDCDWKIVEKHTYEVD
jgi:hypothetical protein